MTITSHYHHRNLREQILQTAFELNEKENYSYNIFQLIWNQCLYKC